MPVSTADHAKFYRIRSLEQHEARVSEPSLRTWAYLLTALFFASRNLSLPSLFFFLFSRRCFRSVLKFLKYIAQLIVSCIFSTT